MFEPVSMKVFGNTNKLIDYIIWCPHASSISGVFFDTFPEVYKYIEVSNEIFIKYIQLEDDVGSLELGLRIASEITEKNKHLKVVVAYSQVPRGIIDLARIWPCSARNIFYNLNSEFYNNLKLIYIKGMETIYNLIQELPIKTGYFIDLHTMSPYSPKVLHASKSEFVIETPYNLEDYVNLYQDAVLCGKRREIDLMTHVSDKLIANQKLIEYIEYELKVAGYNYDFNYPYALDYHLHSVNFMSRRNGITIDIPKDYLCNKFQKKNNFNFFDFSIDEAELNKICKCLSLSLLRLYETKIGKESNN